MTAGLPVTEKSTSILITEFFEVAIMARLALACCMMLAAFGSSAHPYHGEPPEAPLAFIEHRTDDNRPIYTNIPRACFSRGRLTCAPLHPVFRGSGTVKKPAARPGG